MKTIIVDLDNCISDDRWRRKFILPDEPDYHKRFHDYHDKCMGDNLCNREILEQGHHVAIFTGRPTRYLKSTVQWLVNNGVKFDHIIMRNIYDFTPSVTLKAQMLDWLIAYYDVAFSDIVCAYDDRQEIVEMYRERGLNAEILAVDYNQQNWVK